MQLSALACWLRTRLYKQHKKEWATVCVPVESDQPSSGMNHAGCCVHEKTWDRFQFKMLIVLKNMLWKHNKHRFVDKVVYSWYVFYIHSSVSNWRLLWYLLNWYQRTFKLHLKTGALLNPFTAVFALERERNDEQPLRRNMLGCLQGQLWAYKYIPKPLLHVSNSLLSCVASKAHPHTFRAGRKSQPTEKDRFFPCPHTHTCQTKKETDEQPNINMNPLCSTHLHDPRSTPRQSLLPAASVASFPLSSPSPAACERWPTSKQTWPQ